MLCQCIISNAHAELCGTLYAHGRHAPLGKRPTFPKSMGSELRRWRCLWQSKKDEVQRWRKSDDCKLPSNLLLTPSACDSDSFLNIHCLLIIANMLPISSAESECSFSLMRRLKTYTRSAMMEEYLSDLAIIAMHFSESPIGRN